MSDNIHEIPDPVEHYAERASGLPDQVTLRDGTPAWVGPLLPGDGEDLAREYQTLSFASKRHRFLSAVRELTPAMLEHLVDEVDGSNHVALVLFAEQDDGLVPVGIGRIVRYREIPDAADLAVTVKDAWHGRGVATALLPLLINQRPPGVTHILTEVAADNAASLAMLRRVGEVQVHPAGYGVLDVEVDLVGQGQRHHEVVQGQRLHAVLGTSERERLRSRDRQAGV
ncbi:MAG: hypothetical protein IPI32_07940 [Austwickia sp.]|nr:hypothetical protein [Austwickia sp.]MBK8436589.1 hypothetical protein [Austwickia sp.]MBK9102254.1 hypothetical protein [Austwickia sp.]